ncbi:MAG: hypothetical protein R3F59_20480 [Myxococcota bacterium]
MRFDGATIAAVSPAEGDGLPYVVPALIDSHVHLAYFPVGERLLDAGVAAVVDLAAPESALGPWSDGDADGLRIRAAGPMLTAPGGYPTKPWGRDGYGREAAGAAEATAAVAALAAQGATLIKPRLDPAPTLDDDTVRALVDAAHQRGLPVVAHALTDAGAARAAALGVDGLAHARRAARIPRRSPPGAPATAPSW